MRKHHTSFITIAIAAVALVAIQPAGTSQAASGNRSGQPIAPAGRSTVLAVSHPVTDPPPGIGVLRTPEHGTGGPGSAPPGVALALASLHLPLLFAAPVAVVVSVTTATTPPVRTVDEWARLRQCESGDDYAVDTGNGYYGAYQFSASTWHGLGFSGLPSQAPAAMQDQAAQQLQARSGWGQWPACSRDLGL